MLTLNGLHGLADGYAAQYGLQGTVDGDADAFRHALASAITARDYGVLVAQQLGTGVELLGLAKDNTLGQTLMDSENNRRGREIGQNLGPNATNDQIAEAVRDALNRGDLIRQPVDTTPLRKIVDDIREGWNAAKDFFFRRDPLTLDLDNDGLETTGVAATNPILFDHDGDGIKNGTGWVNADDGFLVRDVNGNGTIDSGRELFGDNTIKSNGQLATDGFDALVDLDSIANGGNADGRISNADAQFTNLRIWRDLNQDGISQSNELFTLSSQNIASINVTKTANSQTLANGNQIADLGTFTRTDGSTGTAGAVTGNLADINLASDTFHRTFPDVLDTTSVATLPDMQGSGKVRDLREAANDSDWSLAA